ncbi:DUF6684 family protein [Halomicrobium urmianum]|uniref:DUF6684 family protein n=1 Tax=Halomicrobium urmianum TaxID=1586233 RepID=UPI001CD993E3|nr:DUF6684 family protein [Halomicrobium urmianum]
MTLLGFEKDTLLDLTVNFIPLAIIAFFIAAFAIFPAFSFDPVFSTIQFLLMIGMFAALAILTYYAGRAVEDAEKGTERE